MEMDKKYFISNKGLIIKEHSFFNLTHVDPALVELTSDVIRKEFDDYSYIETIEYLFENFFIPHKEVLFGKDKIKVKDIKSRISINSNVFLIWLYQGDIIHNEPMIKEILFRSLLRISYTSNNIHKIFKDVMSEIHETKKGHKTPNLDVLKGQILVSAIEVFICDLAKDTGLLDKLN